MKTRKITINKILLFVIAGILLFIIAVSAIELCTKNAHPGEGLRKEDPNPSSVEKSKTAFDAIGQIRTFTREEGDSSEKSVILLTPWFEYDGSDTAFYEELDRKHLSTKSLITNYFSTRTKRELLQKGEEKIKSELKSLINDTLVLGKINNIYFNDYLFLD
jgi:flagellar basal body-associated protein FliL